MTTSVPLPSSRSSLSRFTGSCSCSHSIKGSLGSWHGTHPVQDLTAARKGAKLSEDGCALPSESGPTLHRGDLWPQGHCLRRPPPPPPYTPIFKGSHQLFLAVNILFLAFSHVFCALLILAWSRQRGSCLFSLFSILTASSHLPHALVPPLRSVSQATSSGKPS